MKTLLRNIAVVASVACGIGGATAVYAESLEGRWAATVEQAGTPIPFRLDISGDGNNVVGTLYNGEDKEATTSASIQNGQVELNFLHYLVAIEATVKNGELDGKVI